MRRVLALDAELLDRAPAHVRECLAWQLSPSARGRAPADPAARKRAWLHDVLAEWGTCGQVVLVDGAPAGCVVYAPASHLPGAAAYPTSPVSPDALLMASVRVEPPYAGRGLGRVLVQAAVRDLVLRYGAGSPVRALEAIATTDDRAGSAGAPCAPPAGFCAAVGFAERRAHPRHPRMRLDLRSTLTWRGEVGQAWERLRGGVRTPALETTAPRDADVPGCL